MIYFYLALICGKKFYIFNFDQFKHTRMLSINSQYFTIRYKFNIFSQLRHAVRAEFIINTRKQPLGTAR